MTSGVLLSVIGAVQYGTATVFYKIVPHFDAQELRQYLHQVMATFSTTGKDVVMVVDRSGIHRAHMLDTTFDHYDGKLRFHFLPAHCGHWICSHDTGHMWEEISPQPVLTRFMRLQKEL